MLIFTSQEKLVFLRDLFGNNIKLPYPGHSSGQVRRWGLCCPGCHRSNQ